MSADSIAFRCEARPSDVEHVRKIAESTGFFTEAEVGIAVELVEERLSKGLSCGYRFLFADAYDGIPIGYTCFGEIPCTIGSFDLYWIIVHHAHRSRGLGRRLMVRTERMVAELGGRGLYAETSGREQYQPTRLFYLKNGYKIIATLKDFYSPGDDKVVFFKNPA